MMKPTITSARAKAPAIGRGGDRERGACVQDEKQRASLRKFAAVLMHPRRRQRDAGRAHERGDAGENEGRAVHLPLQPAKSLGPQSSPLAHTCQDGRRRRSCRGRACCRD